MSGTKPGTIAKLGAGANDFLYGINNLNRDMVVQVLEDQRAVGGQIDGSFVLVNAGTGTYSEWLTEYEGTVVDSKGLIQEILRKINSGQKNLHLFNRNNFEPYLRDQSNFSEQTLEVDSDAIGGPHLHEVKSGSFRKGISEANLESLLIENLEVLEQGLELVKKQFDCPGVGRLDLLCKDSLGNLVVIELKKFGVKHDSILDQILRYMGYIKQHIATESQSVRGIIVVGRIDEKLKYAVSVVPNIAVKAFDLTIQ